ncbi:MAG: hypothetical protein J6Y53_04490 [Alphaproteobacteria bacterium]|nr:hypothetical protein [Alphaproteobacteria bacterium]
MSFLRFLLFLPIVVALSVLALDNSGEVSISLWPFINKAGEVFVLETKMSILIVALSLFIFIYAKIDSWLAYSHLRSELRTQRRQNKKLNAEQQKLVEKVEGLKENLDSIAPQEQVKAKPAGVGKVSALREKVASWFKRKPKNDDFWCL